MSRRLLASAGLVLAALIVALIWWLTSDEAIETASVERGSIDVTVGTVGTLQLSGNQTVRSRTGGTVIALGATAGDTVETGDILVLVDPEELDRQVDEADRAVEAAEFSLQFAESRAAEDPESLNLRQAILEAQDRLDAANQAADEARERRSSGAIVADHAGTVLELLVDVDDRIGEHQPVAVIYVPADLTLVADVDELDLPNIRIGTEARFRLDAYPATEIEGIVTRTSPQAVQRGGATIFPTEIVFDVPQEIEIRPGMNADVTIITDLRDDILIVPERAIRSVGQRAFVIVVESGEQREIEVTLGYRAGGIAEVVSGLSEGDVVALR